MEVAPRSWLTALAAAINGGVKTPWATITVWVVTAAAGVAQLLHPVLLDQFGRDPVALSAGQWWRMVTPMFVQDGWLPGLVFNLVGLAVVGVLAEILLGTWRWLVVYFGAGLFGNAVSYAWLNPTGAGNSMANAGLLGLLAMAVLVAGRRYGLHIALPLRVAAVAIALLAIVDTLMYDNHGLPLLLGMVLGLVVLPRRLRVTDVTTSA